MSNLQHGAFQLFFPSPQAGSQLGYFPSVWTIQYNLMLQLAMQQQAARKAAAERKKALAEQRAEQKKVLAERQEALIEKRKALAEMREAERQKHLEEEHDAPQVDGLKAEYFLLPEVVSSIGRVNFYKKPDFVNAVDQLDIYRSRKAFFEDGPVNNFAARFSGHLNVEKGGAYTLFLKSDDSAALFIDGTRVILNRNKGPDGLRSGVLELHLAAGVHEIKILYLENTSSQTLQLEWAGPDTEFSRIPISGSSLSYARPETDGDGHTDHGDGDGHTDHGDGDGHTDHGDGDGHTDHGDG
ncbi:PA14 domain-containing protein, partial [uncultured Roseovarius sp.]|uniref:PA14 domain-containing protein n=1 Tax=uncultured Roseovarius sp. TaxID=293344 RepID=UPI002603F954